MERAEGGGGDHYYVRYCNCATATRHQNAIAGWLTDWSRSSSRSRSVTAGNCIQGNKRLCLIYLYEASVNGGPGVGGKKEKKMKQNHEHSRGVFSSSGRGHIPDGLAERFIQ